MWVDLTCWPQANNGSADLVAYPGQRTRVVAWPQANNGRADLVAYQADLRPLGTPPSVPHTFTVAFVEVDVLFATVGGHAAAGGSSLIGRLRGGGRRQVIYRRRRHP